VIERVLVTVAILILLTIGVAVPVLAYLSTDPLLPFYHWLF
jgi:hypothetical protein